LRNTSAKELGLAQTLLGELTESGFPNYYGEQRFGADGETLALGYALLTDATRPRDIPPSRRRFLVPLALSAVQSYLFNLTASERIADGLWGRVLVGDAMQVVASGGPFRAEDVEREQPRCDAGETVVTGPLFGPKMFSPIGEPAEREQRLLARKGLDAGTFHKFPKFTQGTRRPYWIRPQEAAAVTTSDGLELRFSLPRGVYATSLLRCLM
jgi:tRNA pseudouridine13 synthase